MYEEKGSVEWGGLRVDGSGIVHALNLNNFPKPMVFFLAFGTTTYNTSLSALVHNLI